MATTTSLLERPPHPAVAQRSRHGAGSIQRVPIGPHDLETTLPGNRARVLDYLRGVGPVQMGEILRAMEQEQNRANDEYIQICRVELARDAALVQIDNLARESGGVWTTAVVFFERQLWFQTPPVQAGAHGQGDTYGTAAGHNDAETRASTGDAEVGTLSELERIPTLPIPAGRRVDILLVSNMGPCDGCKRRLHEFRQALAQSHTFVNFSLEANYLTAPNDVQRRGTWTTYGHHGDHVRVSPSDLRYHFHPY